MCAGPIRHINNHTSDNAPCPFSILGYLAPLRFIPVLLLQLVYKSIWFVAVLLPALFAGAVPVYGWILAGIFATYAIGDLVAIPFPNRFGREARAGWMGDVFTLFKTLSLLRRSGFLSSCMPQKKYFILNKMYTNSYRDSR